MTEKVLTAHFGPRAAPAVESRPGLRQRLAAWVPVILICSALLPLQWQAGPAVIRAFDLVFATAAFIVSTKAIVAGRIRVPSPRWRFVWLAVLFAGIATATYLTLSATAALREAIQGIEMVLLLWILSTLLADPSYLPAFTRRLSWSLFALAITAIGWRALSGDVFAHGNTGPWRLASGLATVAFLARRLDGQLSARGHFALAFSALLVLVEAERKAWAGIAVALLLTRLVRRISENGTVRRARLGARLSLLAALAVIGSVSAVTPTVRDRISAGVATFADLARWRDVFEGPQSREAYVSSSNQARLVLLYSAYLSIRQNPVLGIGTGTFQDRMAGLVDRENLSIGVHNEYVRVAVENGIPLAILYGMIWLAVLWNAARLARRRNTVIPLVLVTYMGTVNGLLSGGVVNSVFLVIGLALIQQRRAGHVAPS